MCGIAGFLDLSRGTPRDELIASVRRMHGTLVSRGPNDAGEFVVPEEGLALGHRRLSILDLSSAGHQPMTSRSGRFTIVYNGEIYNFAELRTQLVAEGEKFETRSDTEVLLAVIERYGVKRAAQVILGMFAFVLWDREERSLTLARDPAGEKPLYYAAIGRRFYFASELKAIRAHPKFAPEIDQVALREFLRFGYVPCPRAIYRHTWKLPPGCIGRLVSGASEEPRVEVEEYWSARTVAAAGRRLPVEGSTESATRMLESLLADAVRMQMVADVPLGALLSGGIDSSLVVALMQSESRRAGGDAVRTFTIGFEEEAWNEASQARLVAHHLQTRHTELYVTPREAMEVVPMLPTIYDEPFADPSQIPTLLVSRLARRDVTVCLTGDGGDELFGGYNRYAWARRIWSALRIIPRELRAKLRRVVMRVPVERWDGLYRSVPQRIIPSGLRFRQFGDKMHKLADLLDAERCEALYQTLVSTCSSPDHLLACKDPIPLPFLAAGDRWEPKEFVESMMLADFVTYLPDDVLVKLDRAAMSVSLESRVPLLDRRVVEFAWRLPLRAKVRNGEGKRILRNLLYRYVPRSLIDRPKMGFGVPVADWIRGPLKEWAAALVDAAAIERTGLLDGAHVGQLWDQHQKGLRNWQSPLWAVLMLQAWYLDNCD